MLFEYRRGAYSHKTSYMYTLLVRWYSAFTKVQGGGDKEDLIHAPPSAINSMLKEIYKQLSSVGYSTVPDTGTYTVGHES